MNKEGSGEEADADEEVESTDEGSASLRSQSEDQDNAVSCQEQSISEILQFILKIKF